MKLRINKIDYSDRLYNWVELVTNTHGKYLRVDMDDPESVVYEYLFDILFQNGSSNIEVEFDSEDFIFGERFTYNGTMKLVGFNLEATKLRIMMKYEEKNELSDAPKQSHAG